MNADSFVNSDGALGAHADNTLLSTTKATSLFLCSIERFLSFHAPTSVNVMAIPNPPGYRRRGLLNVTGADSRRWRNPYHTVRVLHLYPLPTFHWRSRAAWIESWDCACRTLAERSRVMQVNQLSRERISTSFITYYFHCHPV